jgi:uncharacterized membrane protein
MRRLAPTPLREIILRLIMFTAGALFGAVPLLISYWWTSEEIVWRTVVLVAAVMGVLAALFGKKFWENAIAHWP